METIWKFLIWIVSGLYQVVSFLFQLFSNLSQFNLLANEDFGSITNKIYTILGVVVLFIIAYNVLMMIIDPDKDKNGASFAKVFRNVLFCFVVIVFCPTIFRLAFDAQQVIIDQGIIQNIFYDTGTDIASSISQKGNSMALSVFSAFFHSSSSSVPDNSETEYDVSFRDDTVSNGSSYDYVITYNIKDKDGTQTPKVVSCIDKKSCTLQEVKEAVKYSGDFRGFQAFANNIKKDEISFDWLLALIAGGWLLYVILNYCFDVATRTFKLAFYQIVAPLCIAFKIIPNEEKIFKNWLNAVIKTYISVFIKIFVMIFGVYIFDIFSKNYFDSVSLSRYGLLFNAFLIMGLVTFIREATKIIDDTFGLGDTKLGLRERLSKGGAFVAGAAIGAGATSIVRNATNAWNGWKAKRDKWSQDGNKASLWTKARGTAGSVIGGFGSMVGGAFSGIYNGGKNSLNAKNEKDMMQGLVAGYSKSDENRNKRATYKAEHGGTIRGAFSGHIDDAGTGIKSWAGVADTEVLKKQNASYASLSSAVKGVTDAARDTIISDVGKNSLKKDYGIDASKLFTNEDFNGLELKYNNYNVQSIQNALGHLKDKGGTATVEFYNEKGDVVSSKNFLLKELQALESSYLKDYANEIATVGSTANLNSLSIDLRDNLKDVIDASGKLRKELANNLTSEVIGLSNDSATNNKAQVINSDLLTNGSFDFANKESAINKIKQSATIKIQDNSQKIRDKEEKEAKKN